MGFEEAKIERGVVENLDDGGVFQHRHEVWGWCAVKTDEHGVTLPAAQLAQFDSVVPPVKASGLGVHRDVIMAAQPQGELGG